MDTLGEKKMLFLIILITLRWSVRSQFTIDVTVAKDGSGNFTTITEAILAAPKNSPRRYHIKIKAGLYTEYIVVGINKPNLTFIGDGMDITIISGNRSNATGFSTLDSATAGIEAAGFVALDMTFFNTAGPTKNQAVALKNEAYYSAFFRCSFQGYQDTLFTKAGIQFFRDCEIYGTVDFIFGNAAVVFQNCIVYVHRPLDFQKNTITAQKRELSYEKSGIILQNCTIKAAEDLEQQKEKYRTFLGRPWGNMSTTIIMQSFIHDIIDPEGWLEWEGRNPNSVYYVEYQNRGPGAITTNRVHWATTINNSMDAAKFTVRSFIGGQKWIPSTGIPFFLDLL